MEKRRHFRTFGGLIVHLKAKIKENKRAFVVYCVLRVLVIASLIDSVFQKNYETTMTCVLVLALFLLPALAEDTFKMEIPQLFQILIYIFIFAAEILGEVRKYFVYVHGWDTMLHTTTGFLCAAVGFSMVYLLNRNSRHIDLSPKYLALTAFCFAMTIGVLWEFFECGADLFLGADMQKDFIVQQFNSVTLDPNGAGNVAHIRDITQTVITTASGQTYTIDGGYLDIGLLDTMKDLFVSFIGAVVFVVIGYFYVRKHPEKAYEGGLILRPAESPAAAEPSVGDS